MYSDINGFSVEENRKSIRLNEDDKNKLDYIKNVTGNNFSKSVRIGLHLYYRLLRGEII